MSHDSNKNLYEPIAIVGMGCRFPGGANDPYQFWENIKNGMDCLQPTPESRWNTETYFSQVKGKKGKMNTRWGGYIDGFDEFDPLFFGISPREADYIDPQQRKLLEVSWEAIEDGGFKPSELSGKAVGVFIGGFTVDYKILQFTNPDFANIDAHTATGVMMTMLSNRISYIYNFKGPSLTIDTACSSSLVSIDLACRSLQQGECEMALAGGVLMTFAPQYTVSETQGGFLSPTGSSHALSDTANGYVRSEGVGVLVLKTLAQAEADGDFIHAVILGTAVNQDGRTNGITVPSADAQLTLMEKAYHRAGVSPGKVQYIEIHGTGTPVGDPVEAQSVGRLLNIDRQANDRCYIGSVKTNIGHTEAAAGSAGLIKTIMALKNKQIPPHLHFNAPNPAIAFADYPYTVPTELTPWPAHEGLAIAGVNSFGFGGTNAHVVLREYQHAPLPVPALAENQSKLLLISNTDKDALLRQVQAYSARVQDIEALELHHLSYSSAVRRELHPYRALFVYHDKAQLLERLSACFNGQIVQGVYLEQPQTNATKLVWVLTGMGPQWWGMGRELYQTVPLFRAALDKIDQEFSRWVDWSLKTELFASEADSKMSETWLAQTANFAIQVALAELWQSYGIQPEAIVGHSTGEVAAFYLAGVYSLADAVKIVVHRSRLQHATRGSGKMLAVGLSEHAVMPYLAPHHDKVSIGAVNSPSAVTLTGDSAALESIAKNLEADEVFNRFLRVEVPYHSVMMEKIKAELLASLADIAPQAATIPLYSTVSGQQIDGTEGDAHYWWRNVREPVAFAKAIETIFQTEAHYFLEIGPHPVLGASITEIAEHLGKENRNFYSIRRNAAEQEDFYGTLAMLAGVGFAVDWQAMYPHGQFVPMPRYQWRPEKHWYETPFYRQLRRGQMAHPLLGAVNAQSKNVWDSDISLEKYPYLQDHVIQDSCLFPAAGYVEMVYGALTQHWGDGLYSIDALKIEKGVFLSEDKNPPLKLSLDEANGQFKIISVSTSTDEHHTPLVHEDRHISGFIRSRTSAWLAPAVDLNFEQRKSQKTLDKTSCYALLTQFSYQYGTAFQGIEQVFLAENQVLAKIVLPPDLETSGYHLHPALLDSCLQTLILDEIERSAGQEFVVRLPMAIHEIHLNPHIGREFWCLTKIVARDDEKIIGDLLLCDEHGTVVGSLLGFNAQAVDSVASGMSTHTIDNWLYQSQWLPQSHEASETVGLKKAYLLFADQSGAAQSLAEKLRTQSSAVCVVNASPSYSVSDDFNAASVQLDNPSHIRQCVSTFYQQYGENSAVIHAVNLDTAPSFDVIDSHDFERLKKSRLHSLVLLAKVMAETEIKSKLWVITCRGQQVVADDAAQLNLMSASIAGISRVLAQQELGDNWGGLIDVADKNDVDAVLAELALNSEEEISYRGERYVNRLSSPTDLKTPFPVRLQANACYLVAGGFGAIGRLVCQWLIAKGARRLLIMSRSTFPKRESWRHIDPNHRLYERIQFIIALEAMGAEVILADVDVSRERELRHYLNTFAEQGYPPIRGVFFCSGVIKDTLLSSIQPIDFDEVYDTKVIGAVTLHQCLKTPLDYFVLFSSIAAQVTTAGQINYASANSCLDALAHYRRSQGLSALSINWGPWAIGMIKELGLGEHYKNQRGMMPILPEAGMKVLERIVNLSNPQLSVCDANWNKVLDWYPKKPSLFKELARDDEFSEQEGDFLTSYLQCDADNRAAFIENEFITLVAAILRTDAANISAGDTLIGLGIDSIMGVELNIKMQGHFGERLSVVKLLGNLNLGQLAAELHDKIAELAAAKANTSAGETSETAPAPEGCCAVGSCEVLEIEEEYPLSYGQKAIWFTHELNPDSAAYNIGGAMHIPAEINITVLEKAINGVIQKHPSLRANFYIVNGEPVQRIYARRPFQLQVIDVEGQNWEMIRRQVIADNQRPFNLENDRLLRVRLYRQAHNSYYFAITIYHIVSDAWSNYMFLNDMQALYVRYLTDDEVAITPAKTSYRDFVEWESRLINSIRGNSLYKFWRNRLPATIPQLALPTDKKRPPVMTNNGASYNFVIHADLTKQLQNLAKREGVTMFMALLSLYYTLMHKVSQQNDIIIGSPVAGRTQAEFGEVYGYFVNPLPLWVNFDGQPNFLALLKQVRDTTLMGLEHQEFPFSLLVDRLEIEHDPSRSAIFQVMFVLLNHRVERTHIDENDNAHYEGFPMRLLQMPEEEGQFDLTLTVYEEKGVYYATFKYNTDLFVESSIARLATHFLELANQAIDNPTQAVSSYHLPTAQERETLLNDYSGRAAHRTLLDSPLLHERIEAFAAQTGDALAVRMEHEAGHCETLRYAELNAQANQIAHALLAQGTQAGDVVGLYLNKSPLLISALLACLKVGATYVILDPELPNERLKVMREAAKAVCVLKAQADIDTPALTVPVHALDNVLTENTAVGNLNVEIDRQQGAYIVFTSGSTGVPKGVLVTQQNMAAMADAWQQAYHLDETQVHLQMANVGFDVFCGDWIRALSNGKILQLCPRNTLLNMPLLLQTIEKYQVDFAEFVPTVMRKLVHYAQQKGQTLAIKTILVASERWTLEDYQQLRAVSSADRIINSYGTSETTIDSTYFELTAASLATLSDSSDGIPIGKPFCNTRVYVLDTAMNPVPVGVLGELYIGGDGVSWGYVNDAEKMRQVFVSHAFSGEAPQRLYKTGDLVTWDEHGYLHFAGRGDKQVKIRGNRIELSEIENALLACAGIKNAIVLIQDMPSQEPCLVAYYQLHDGAYMDDNALPYTLAEHLPSYMIPAFFQKIDKIPELENGKINFKALPKPQEAQNQAVFHAPQTLYEVKLAQIWGKMLGVQNVGLYDDFFALGGNSLYLIELMVQIQETFAIQISVNQLFKLSTLAGIAKTVEEVVTGKIQGALPYSHYNRQPSAQYSLFSFPPAGGYSIVYQTLAQQLHDIPLISFNYLMDANKVAQYADLISTLQPTGKIHLLGYSLGGNLAFEVARELENRQREVANVIILDSYRITDSLTISEQLLDDFREELRQHFKKHTGSDKVEEHTMKQANNYIDFCYQQKNLQVIQAKVHFMVEENEADPYRDNKLHSWEGSSTTRAQLYIGRGLHEDMLLGENAKANAAIIRSILQA